ncbi:MAG: hypothetical protein EZS28_034022, partial [Streblomastix strix]
PQGSPGNINIMIIYISIYTFRINHGQGLGPLARMSSQAIILTIHQSIAFST